MRKKTTLLSIAVLLILSLSNYIVFAGDIFDLSFKDHGKIRVNYDITDGKYKVMVEKDDIKYFYDLQDEADFPLQMGSGDYTVSILKNIEQNRYTTKGTINFKVELENKRLSFLQSAVPVRWDKATETAKLAAELTDKLKSDEEKVKAVYTYVIKNIKYDYEKIKNLNTDYLPDTDKILEEGRGICYDYAVLYAAMLRSIGIPTKLVKGYKNDIDGYHAWNEVYISEKGWVIMDTTYDSIYLENGTSINPVKNIKEYNKVREY